MHRIRQVPTLLEGTLRLIEVLRATIVHAIRRETGRSSLGFLSALARPLVFLGTFYVIIEYLGVRGIAIRGSTLTFLLTGIFCFLVHVGAVQKVAGAIRKSRSMMHHAPATILIQVLAQALGVLYLHLLAALTIWAFAELIGGGLNIQDPAGLMLPYFLSWASGVGLGMVLMVLSYMAPTTAEVIATVYTRVQFFTSGKFWAANIMPAGMVEYATWNPLLHIIDQMRGAAFVNYTPQHTEMGYPVSFTLVALLTGFMLERWVRGSFSLSRLRT